MDYRKSPTIVGLLACLAIAVAGCVGGGATSTSPAPSIAALEYSNQTSIPIDLFVNGGKVATIAPGTNGSLSATELPAQPWAVEARTSSGRVMTALTIRVGDVASDASSFRGVAVRLNLSCGVLDIWSGPPLIGPAGTGGAPGDCNP